jgi:DNA helicase-2/ATP-dependent DNA helicase PcrA
MDFNTRYRQLNPAQKRAVDTIDGPVMVVAGPGTGKTELLSVRTANILSKTDALPENILCLTFTESGAAAMRERLIGIIGKDAYRVAIHTFHGFGSEIINQNREYFYRGAQFEPADDLNRYEILRSIFDELDYKNPLASMMNGEYTHQPDASRVISELKRSGLTSGELLAVLEANEAALDASERLVAPLISGPVSKSTKDALAKVLPDLQSLADSAETQFEVSPLIRTITDGLAVALEEAEAIHPTKPITAWKKRWFVKNDKGNFVFKSRQAIVKLRALANVYDTYLSRMEQASLYDYDDMILQVVHAMEVNDDLRFNLQEKYLYIMVDEFQDTNLAQMRIINNLTDNPVHEGRPNVLVVGDDDQAIYSFQGADISNILRFQELFPSTEIIPLTDNYRSVDTVIEESRTVILQGGDRLETRIETLSKELTGHQEGKGSVALYQAETIEQERRWLVQQIAEDIRKGVKPNNIAILTRRHGEIQSLLPYFAHTGIPVHYERQENVLEQPPIVVLELLARVVVHLAKSQHDQANALLPELLAHPAWGIEAKELWQLSMDAYTGRKLWLEVMATTPRFVDIHAWLVELTAASLATPLEQMLDRMIGRPTDEETSPSPFYEHFFSETQRDINPVLYLDYLTALRTIRAKLREYHQTDKLTLESLLHFISLHRRLGTQLMVSRPEAEVDPTAIHLMTAHKSKGLEFECVYIINCVDSMWGERARSPGRMISYPENLPLAFVGDTADERLRLFYVAMTRAKRQLTMSFSKQDDSGRSTLLASFLSEREPKLIPDGLDASELTETAEIAWYQPLVQSNQTLHDILKPALANYKLSATHLNTFLDVTNGGPQAFLLNNLLHFPSAKSTAASYGSAIHATLQQAHVHLAATGEQKPLEDVLHDFETNLAKERLDALDYATYVQKGSEQLQAYLTERMHTFVPTQKAELDFRSQEVMLDEARLTGLIDVVDLNPETKQAVVTDYKTGKPIVGGKSSTDYEKIKLHKYRQQLMFYKLLVEGSRDYHTYQVDKGCLEFIEPTASGTIECREVTFDKEELARFKQLINAVWHHITTLELPDISEFEQNYRGVLAFEDYLLASADALTN